MTGHCEMLKAVPCAMLSCAKSLSRVRLSVTPWPIAHQAPLSLGILQARILERIAGPSSRGSSRPRDGTGVSCLAGGSLAREAL